MSPQSRIPGLTRAAFKGGYTLSFWVADVATGEAREVWHNKPDDQTFARVNTIEWAGTPSDVLGRAGRVDSVLLGQREAAERPIRVLTPGDGMVENVALSSDGKTLYYCTNAGDIDRRHVWSVPTAGGDCDVR